MPDLRTRLIRLAHERPELRSHLLPLLRDASAPDMLDASKGRAAARVLRGVVEALQGEPGFEALVRKCMHLADRWESRVPSSDEVLEVVDVLETSSGRIMDYDVKVEVGHLRKQLHALGSTSYDDF